MKLLLVEDDLRLSENIAKHLKKNLFAVDTVFNIEDASFQIEEFANEYDLILLDINLPDGDGFEFCQKIRQQGCSLPIIIMTARSEVSDKVKGLDLGADDYISKPVDFSELVARVRALIRRNSKDPAPVLSIDNLSMNPQTQLVMRNKKTIVLSSREFSVLEFMMRHHDEVITRTMIMEHVWGSDFETFSNVIDVYIKNLRKKIDTKGEQKLIHTIRGSGYSLSDKR